MDLKIGERFPVDSRFLTLWAMTGLLVAAGLPSKVSVSSEFQQ
jgi:hypothetical protein